MSADDKAAERLARRALSGKASHAQTKEVFSGLALKAAGSKPRGASHSVYELLWHMSYWQDWAIAWLDGEKPAVPRHASGSWPAEAGPAGKTEWEEAVKQFRGGLAKLEQACRGAGSSTGRGGGPKRLEMLHTIAAHNSYHAGQVALLRQLLGTWPPPSGGVTW